MPRKKKKSLYFFSKLYANIKHPEITRKQSVSSNFFQSKVAIIVTLACYMPDHSCSLWV